MHELFFLSSLNLIFYTRCRFNLSDESDVRIGVKMNF